MNEYCNTIQDPEKKAIPAADSPSDAPILEQTENAAVAALSGIGGSDETVAPASHSDASANAPAETASDLSDDASLEEAVVKTPSTEEDDSWESGAAESDGAEPSSPKEETIVVPDEGMTREERFQLELEELSRKHAEDVARNVERAKDPALYDTYQATPAKMDEKIRIFSARRQGRSHISGKIPCQDYCLTADTEKGVILTDADGVGSCNRSDIGSRLACSVTVDFIRELDGQCETEEQFVNRLCSLRFRELLVRRWLQAVLAHAKENPDETVSPNKIHELYGSTLMFAVITHRYYVVGNLGDGQILLFNDAEGFKLRLHAPKESTKVRALVHPNCYREDFQVHQYSRKDFSGVLLTTDGMYDVLCNGNVLYQYVQQLKTRFLEAGEPLQPFCFVEGEEAPKDLFSHRTKDDCSIVLAVDTAFSVEDLGGRLAAVGEGMDHTVPCRLTGDTACYWLEKDQMLFLGVVTPEEKKIAAWEELSLPQGIRWVMPLSRKTVSGDRYSLYWAGAERTVDELYHYGALREQTERTPNASREVLQVYSALLRCKRFLRERGYCFTAAAGALVRWDPSGVLLLPAEAVMPAEQGVSDGFDGISRYFDSLAGKLVSDTDEYPVFRLGYFSVGQRMFLSDRPQDPMYRVTRDAQGTVSLINRGTLPWITADGSTQPGEKLPLREGLTFWISDDSGARITYRYVSKEEM